MREWQIIQDAPFRRVENVEVLTAELDSKLAAAIQPAFNVELDSPRNAVVMLRLFGPTFVLGIGDPLLAFCPDAVGKGLCLADVLQAAEWSREDGSVNGRFSSLLTAELLELVRVLFPASDPEVGESIDVHMVLLGALRAATFEFRNQTFFVAHSHLGQMADQRRRVAWIRPFFEDVFWDVGGVL